MVSKNKTRKSWKSEYVRLFEDSLKHISEQRNYIYAMAFVFFASSFLGYIYSSELVFFDNLIRGIVDKTQGLDFLELVWFIFSNNITSAVSSFALGAILGIFPFFNALFNGTLLGYVYSKAAPIAGFGVIWRLLPHGIFELPAIFIALGLGAYIGASFFGKDKFRTFKSRFNKSLIAFLVIVLPLLILAAIIESFLISFIG